MATVREALDHADDTAFAIAMSDLVFARYEAAGFAGLSPAEQTVHCLDWLEREVNNGGFDQFFFNSAGDTARETVAALERLGAPHTAGIVRRAMGAFPGGLPPADRDARCDLMQALPDAARELWGECDAAFLEYREDLAALERAYVAAHAAEFGPAA